MKIKKIPADIKLKTIKEAQNEIKSIIGDLENSETDLEESMNLYNRMLLLNYHIQEKFKGKTSSILLPVHRGPHPAFAQHRPPVLRLSIISYIV